MQTRSARRTKAENGEVRYVPSPFQNGDRFDQRTFHKMYRNSPDNYKAELIGGIVYVASPVKRRHGIPHGRIVTWLGVYAADCEYLELLDNTTNILEAENEPQPDAALIITPEAGGQTAVDASDYVLGPPEFVVEVANSSAAIDRHAKRQEYESAGVLEYLIVVVETQTVEWFARGKRGFAALKPDAAGVYRSRVFPGLWLDPVGVFERTAKRLLAVLNDGLASGEHAKFVTKLQKAAARRMQ